MPGGPGINSGPAGSLWEGRSHRRGRRAVDARFPEEADYADRPTAWTGWLDWLFGGEALTGLLGALMIAGCCFVAPAAGFLAGLGLLVCQTPEARHNAAFLLALAAIQSLLCSYVVIAARLA